MSDEHISSQYDADLDAMRSKVLLMGGWVESQFKDATDSFKAGNVQLAAKAIAADGNVNQLEVDLDNTCRQIILKRQPAANDLRTVMATVKVITELARIGEESSKIARISQSKDMKRGVLIFNDYDAIRGLANQVRDMLHEILTVLARLDETKAVTLINRNDDIICDFRAVMRTLMTYMMEDPHTMTAALDTLWIAKSIERISDHIKHIAQHVVFIVEGRDVRHTNYAATQNNKKIADTE